MYITRTSTISGIERTLDIPVTDEDLVAVNLGSVPPYISTEDLQYILYGNTAEDLKKREE